MRVLVCGGRKYADRDRVRETLNRLSVERGGITLIIHGGAPGADELADKWSKAAYVERIVFVAEWHVHGRRAGPLRNQRMVDEGKPDLCVAFPGGIGTADMVRRARKAGIEVVEVP